MKKVFFALISVVFALSLITCEVFAPPPAAEKDLVWDDGLGPLEPGEFFVGMSRTGSGRALTAALAEAGADYFEVVFTNGTLYERAAFSEGRVVRMRVPAYGQVYNNVGIYRAYVFAGRNESRMLLGIGMIDEVDGPSNTPSDQEILADTTSVSFKLEALLTDVNSTIPTVFATPTAGDSTFAINDTRVSAIDVPVPGNYTVPVFLLPPNETGLAARFTYRLTNTHTFAVNLFSAILPAATGASITTRPTVLEGYENQLATNVTTTTIATASVGTNPTDARLNVTFNIATDKDGLGLLYIDIPVYLLDGPTGGSPTAVTWRLRGGLNNALIDAGISHNHNDGSLGGAILLGVGSVFDGAGFEVGHGYN